MEPIGRLAELTGDWRYLIQRDGFWASLAGIALDIARLPYRHLRFVIFERSLCDPLPDLPPRLTLEIRPFEYDDLEQAGNLDRPSEAQQCARRLKLGQKGLVAVYQGQIVGYAWGCKEVNPEVEKVPIQLEPGDVLCTDVFTAPSFRGQGIQSALSIARFRMFRDIGFSRAVCYIEVRNAPSLAVWQRKLGGVMAGSVDFLRVGPWYRVQCNKTQRTGP